MDKQVPDILILANKERFRRRLLISSRVIGVFLILVIFWIGFIQIQYVKEVNEIKTEYGSLGYCYMCGLETGRSCGCNYLPKLVQGDTFDKEVYFKNIASQNVMECKKIGDKNINLSEIIIKT